MSLLQSIFGGTDDEKVETASQDVFNTTFEVPKPTPAPPIITTTKRAAESVTPAEEVQAAANEGDNIRNTKEDDEERTIFVGNLPVTITRKSLAALFADCGKVSSTRIRSVATTGVQLPASSAGNQRLVKKVCTHTNKIDACIKNSVHAYVVFQNVASVAVALETKNNLLVEDHNIRVDTAQPTIDPQRSVFVGNLPYASQEETLRMHFINSMPSIKNASANSATSIQGVRIVRDKETFQCRGFAYVLFADKSLVSEALQKVHATTYMKKELRVLVCGKRFKAKQGKYSAAENAKRRKLPPKERVSTSTGALKRILTKQIVNDAKPKTSDKTDKKRKRGDAKKFAPGKAATHKAGVSKRQASSAKQDKKEKVLQKRMTKGMGKNKRA
ncbi:hypothetical protein MPSEU_000464400 [Mayamaea pseudoterrestris]|nr:hypothetical protein MPSEU_000464400 [Mayamaea pseudoterrestris]